jgi:hypothetical protein
MSERTVPPRRLWWLLAGFGVWCSALVFLYALHAVGCAFAWSTSALQLSLALVLLVHLGAIVWMWRDRARGGAASVYGPTSAFLHTVTIWTLIAALATVVLTLGPMIALRSCV